MARDLSFWKLKSPVEKSNEEVYQRLSNGEYIPGVEQLPIDEIINDFQITFYN